MQHLRDIAALRIDLPHLAFRWRSPRWKFILRSVAAKHGMTVAQLTGRDLGRRFDLARAEAVWLMHAKAGLNFPRIGVIMGERCKTSARQLFLAHTRRLAVAAEIDRGLRAIMAETNFRPAEPRPPEQGPALARYIERRNRFIVEACNRLPLKPIDIARMIGMHPDTFRGVLCTARKQVGRLNNANQRA